MINLLEPTRVLLYVNSKAEFVRSGVAATVTAEWTQDGAKLLTWAFPYGKVGDKRGFMSASFSAALCGQLQEMPQTDGPLFTELQKVLLGVVDEIRTKAPKDAPYTWDRSYSWTAEGGVAALNDLSEKDEQRKEKERDTTNADVRVQVQAVRGQERAVPPAVYHPRPPMPGVRRACGTSYDF